MKSEQTFLHFQTNLETSSLIHLTNEDEMQSLLDTKFLQPTIEKHIEDIDSGQSNVDQNSAVANIQNVHQKQTDGIFPDDIKVTMV